MNYKKHYNALINKAKNRILDGYYEIHHIVPRCLGGDDNPENLIKLTPEEHYVAHQLLVKIYPNEPKLIYAAYAMILNSKNTKRNNKIYGWIRRKLSQEARKRTGSKNGSYGSFWITNGKESKRIKDSNIPEGWVLGRTIPNKCPVCDRKISKNSKFCSDHKIIKWDHLKDAAMKKIKNSYFINNGIIDKRIQPGDDIPEGFQKGRINGLRKAKPPKH